MTIHSDGRRRNRSRHFVVGSAVLAGIAACWCLWHFGQPLARRAAPPQVLWTSSGTFAEGPLGLVLQAHAVSGPEITEVVRAYKGRLDPRSLQAKDRYYLKLSTSSVLERISIVRHLQEYVVARGSDTRYGGVSVAGLPLVHARKGASGRVRLSLWDSFQEGGLSPGLLVVFADLFAWKIDFLTECRQGDRFALVWEEESTREGVVAGSRILAAVYEGRETGRRVAVRFGDRYYDEGGQSLESVFLRAPLQYRRISSFFSKRRFHPILRIFRPHYGIDYAAPTGTPVSSVADGHVVFAGWKGGYGKYVEVRHANGYTTGYGHLSRISPGIAPGARVAQGQGIGSVGMTGLATGPHLDFSIRKSGQYVNFLQLRFQSSGSVGKGELPVFRSLADSLVGELGSLLEAGDRSADSTNRADAVGR